MAQQVKDYYGSRARIGAIYMSSSTVMEPEFTAMAPDGVSIHTTRLHLPDATVKGLSLMMEGDGVEACTRELARAPLQVILFCGTSASFLKGMGWDRKVQDRMDGVANGIPTTTTSTAMLKALRILGIERLSLVTPYIDEVTDRGRVFLEQNGFTVLNSDGMGIVEDQGIGAVTSQQLFDFARDHIRPEAEGVFISCTNLRTIGAIGPLEDAFGVPVVSALQVSFWDCLRIAGVPTKEVTGFGRLFQA